jgi:hypothetical protein
MYFLILAFSPNRLYWLQQWTVLIQFERQMSQKNGMAIWLSGEFSRSEVTTGDLHVEMPNEDLERYEEGRGSRLDNKLFYSEMDCFSFYAKLNMVFTVLPQLFYGMEHLVHRFFQ